eukprot:tig00021128_g18889.t1
MSGVPATRKVSLVSQGGDHLPRLGSKPNVVGTLQGPGAAPRPVAGSVAGASIRSPTAALDAMRRNLSPAPAPPPAAGPLTPAAPKGAVNAVRPRPRLKPPIPTFNTAAKKEAKDVVEKPPPPPGPAPPPRLSAPARLPSELPGPSGAAAAANTSKRDGVLAPPPQRKDGRAARDVSPGAAMSPVVAVAQRAVGAVSSSEALSPGGQNVTVRRKTSIGGSSVRPRSASSTQRTFNLPPGDEIPVPRKCVTAVALQNAGKLRDKPAIIDAGTGRALSYAELERSVKLAALGLRRFGYRAGHVFAFLGGGGAEWAVALHAVALIGGTVTLVPPNANVDAAVAQMREGEAVAAFATEPACDLALDAASRDAQIQDVFVFGSCSGATPFAEVLARNRRASRIRSSMDASAMGLVLSGVTASGSGLAGSVLEEMQAPVSIYSHPLLLLYRRGAGAGRGRGRGGGVAAARALGTPRSGSLNAAAESSRLALTHHNVAASLVQLAAAEDWDESDVTVLLPHAYTPYQLIVSYILPLYLGSTVVAMSSYSGPPSPSPRSVTTALSSGASAAPVPPLLSGAGASSPIENGGAGFEAWLALVTEHRATRADVTAPVLLALLKSPAVDAHLATLSRLRSLNLGPVPVAEPFQRLLAVRLGAHVRLRLGYGCFEAPLTHLTSPAKPQFGVAGAALLGTACRVVDERTGQQAAAGRSGAIYVRGPQVARPVPPLPAPADEEPPPLLWLPTGDHGSVDEEGCLRVSEPRRDVLHFDGLLRVPLAHVEAVLLSHPSVHDAAVVPVPDEEHHQVAKAYVVPSSTHATHANLAQLELFNWIKAGDPASKAAAAASGQAAAEGHAAAERAGEERGGGGLKPAKSMKGGGRTPGRTARAESPRSSPRNGGPGIAVHDAPASALGSDSPRPPGMDRTAGGGGGGGGGLARRGGGTARPHNRGMADSDEEEAGPGPGAGPPRALATRRASRSTPQGADSDGPEEKDSGRLRELLSPSAPLEEAPPGPATTGLSRQAAELMALAQEIKSYIADRLSPYAQLRAVEFMPRLPKSPSGRTLHRRLLEKEDNAYSDEETAAPAF